MSSGILTQIRAHSNELGTTSFALVLLHADFVVVAKAAGVSFHSEDGAGLAVQVAETLGFAVYPVHRLDKITSGLLILARSSQAAAQLSAMFAKQQIQKYYLALSLAKPKQKQGWVKGDMVAARRGAYKLTTTSQNPAISYFFSVGFTEPTTLPSGCRAFLIKPFTGKTHQIRVALKSMSAPIAGDTLYQADAADRVYLHAYALDFVWQGQSIQLILPPSQGAWFSAPELTQLLATAWAQPWTLAFPTLKKSEYPTEASGQSVACQPSNNHADAGCEVQPSEDHSQ